MSEFTKRPAVAGDRARGYSTHRDLYRSLEETVSNGKAVAIDAKQKSAVQSRFTPLTGLKAHVVADGNGGWLAWLEHRS